MKKLSALFALAAFFIASHGVSSHASPLLSEPVLDPRYNFNVPGLLDVSVGTTVGGRSIGDDVFAGNVTDPQIISRRTSGRPITSYFRVGNEMFDVRDPYKYPRRYRIFSNTVGGTPAFLGASRGSRDFGITYQDITGGGNVTAQIVRNAYCVNVTTDADTVIRQVVKPTRGSKYRSTSAITSLSADTDTSIGMTRYVPEEFLKDEASVELSKKAAKKPKKKKRKTKRSPRPSSLF